MKQLVPCARWRLPASSAGAALGRREEGFSVDLEARARVPIGSRDLAWREGAESMTAHVRDEVLAAGAAWRGRAIRGRR